MLYNTYADRIKNIVAQNKQRKDLLSKGRTIGAIGSISGTPVNIKKHLLKEQLEFAKDMHFDQSDLLALVANVSLHNSTLGMHPDFSYLKGTDDTEYHWIISIFVDIQGSTNLFRDYNNEEIFNITNTIQSAVIHTIVKFGGHIQRLQGDGVLAYFGGKKDDKEDAVRRAMTAAAFISYFVKNDLKDLFLKDDIEEINTRIGIDFGDDETVMWANFGVEHISELTTLSLHTSLAAKMQAHAKSNGIVAGNNIKNLMPGNENYFELVSEENRYIFKDPGNKFYYTQWIFKWYQFLKKQPFICCENDGSLSLVRPVKPVVNPPAPPIDYSGLAAIADSNKPYGN